MIYFKYTMIIVLALIIFIFFVLCLPFKYFIRLNINDKKTILVFKYLFIKFYLYLEIPYIKSLVYYLNVFFIRVVDSKRKSIKGNRIKSNASSSTKFIKDKAVETQVNVDRKVFISLLEDSKKLAKRLKVERQSNDKDSINIDMKNFINNVIDKIKTIIPTSKINTIKKVNECLSPCYHIVLPNKFSLNMNIGFDDPYDTGSFLTYVATFYTVFGDQIKVVPDFEKETCDCKAYIKGNIFLIPILIQIIKLYVYLKQNKKSEKLC